MDYIQKREEKKNKKRGFFFTFLVHSGVVAMLFIPWIANIEEDKKKPDGIVIKFEQEMGSASERSSKRGKKTEKMQEKKKTTPPVPKKKETPKPKPKPTPKPIPPQKTKPVIKQELPQPKFEVPKAPPPPPEEIPEEIVEEVPEPPRFPDPEPVEEPDIEPATEITEDPVALDPKYSGPPPYEGDAAEGDSANESGNEGEGDQGSSKTGDSDTDGKADSGSGGHDFSGDGVLMRDVVKKADFSNLIKNAGRMVINVCINPNGDVTFAEYNYEDSTIDDAELIELAVDVIKRYRFAKDAYAAKRECGKLSYVFDIKN